MWPGSREAFDRNISLRGAAVRVCGALIVRVCIRAWALIYDAVPASRRPSDLSLRGTR